MYTLGVDIGSTTTKAVVIDHEKRILGYAITATGGDNRRTAEAVCLQAQERAKINSKDISCTIATGYGRENFPMGDGFVTEITCHGRGVHHFLPEARTIIEIGGQDTKAILLDHKGNVLDFAMNDKCAAGTGRFLEVMANALGVQLTDLQALSKVSMNSVKISSMCTVFAESEVVSLVAKGALVPDIIKGLHDSISDRSIMLLKRIKYIEPVAMSGGVANNLGIIDSFQQKLDTEIKIPDTPQIIGAVGAALIAQHHKKA